jgi:hypothetical protein
LGRKSSRKTYVSKGIHSNVSASTKKLVKASPVEAALNKIKAWRKGKNPWITVVNSENRRTKSNTPYIKIRANDLYGNPKFAQANLFRGD